MRRLEQENQEAGQRLEEVVRRGEVLLEKIQSALADIAQSQLDMQQLATVKSKPASSEKVIAGNGNTAPLPGNLPLSL